MIRECVSAPASINKIIFLRDVPGVENCEVICDEGMVYPNAATP